MLFLETAICDSIDANEKGTGFTESFSVISFSQLKYKDQILDLHLCLKST